MESELHILGVNSRAYQSFIGTKNILNFIYVSNKYYSILSTYLTYDWSERSTTTLHYCLAFFHQNIKYNTFLHFYSPLYLTVLFGQSTNKIEVKLHTKMCPLIHKQLFSYQKLYFIYVSNMLSV